MPNTNPRTAPLADIGPGLRTLCYYTKAAYTAAGTSEAAVDDYVTFDATGNWHVEIAEDNRVARIGRVVKVEKEAGSGTGELVVEWMDVIRFVELPIDDLSTATLLNSAIKDGATTVVANFDAGASTGNMIVVSKSGTAGAGTIVCAVVAA